MKKKTAFCKEKDFASNFVDWEIVSYHGRYLDYVKAKIGTEFQEKTKEDLVLKNIVKGSFVWIRNMNTGETVFTKHTRKGSARFKMWLSGDKNIVLIRIRKAIKNEIWIPFELEVKFFKGIKPYIIRQERDHHCD